MIGEQIQTKENSYTVLRELVPLDRPNAHLYLCEDPLGKKYVAKHFYSSSPRANIGYGVVNHFGRRRDGSERIFNEIREKCSTSPFLVQHIDRVNHRGKWVIILEYIEGEDLRDFVISNGTSDPVVVKLAITALVKTLRLWHASGFAHGDPHLSNALLQRLPDNAFHVVLIDYSIIHHPDFHYCQNYDCFKTDPLRRIREDIANDFGNLGAGFMSDIISLEREYNWNDDFSKLFWSLYSEQ